MANNTTTSIIPQGIPNVSEFYFATSGELLEKFGNFRFYAQSNYSNIIIVNIEGGNTNQEINLINFTPLNTIRQYTSHWFYLSPIGVKDYIINGETLPRTFYSYYIIVPSIVLLNNVDKIGITNEITIVKRYGLDNLGMFNTLTDLTTQIIPTETLYESNAFAYVLSGIASGFYQVDRNLTTGNYVWVLRDNIMNYGLMQKQYAVQEIYVNKGNSNVANLPNISTQTVQMLMQILNQTQTNINDLDSLVIKTISKFDTDSILIELNRVGSNVSIRAILNVNSDLDNLIIVNDNGVMVSKQSVIDTINDTLKDTSSELYATIIEILDNYSIAIKDTDSIELRFDSENRLSAYIINDYVNNLINIKVEEHNTSSLAHNDIRQMIINLENTKASKSVVDDLVVDNINNKQDIADLSRDKLNVNFIDLPNKSSVGVNDLIIVKLGAITYKTTISALITLLSSINGSTALVFENNTQIVEWLNGTFVREDGVLPSDLVIGQSIFTVDSNDNDYWVSKLPVVEIADLTAYSGEAVDLTNYFTKNEVLELLENYVLSSELVVILQDYVKYEDLQNITIDGGFL